MYFCQQQMLQRREDEEKRLAESGPNNECTLYAHLFAAKINRLTDEQWLLFEADCNKLLDYYLQPKNPQVQYTTAIIEHPHAQIM